MNCNLTWRVFSTRARVIVLAMMGSYVCIAVATASDESVDAAADQVIFGKTYTMESTQPWVDAIAVRDGHIIYAGSEAGAEAWIDAQTEVLELPADAMVLPGLHDIHMHPLEAGSSNLSCEVDSADSVDDWLDAIQICANSGTGWVLGHGFSISALIEDGRDPRALLDSVSNNRPVLLMEETSHAAWANSAALASAGITASTPNPSGGHIGHNKAGTLNGLLMDTANDMLFHHAFEKAKAGDPQKDYQGLLWALEKIRANGLTSIANARVYWRRGNLEAWYRAHRSGELTARATLALWFYPEYSNDAVQVDDVAALFDVGDDFLRVNEIKMYDDGISINTTAAMHAPYLQDLGFGLPSKTGLNYFSESRLGDVITRLERKGFRVNIHAIGDRGVHEALNAIEQARQVNDPEIARRHRLTHVEFVGADDLPRFDQLNVIADAQVAGEWTLPKNHSTAEIDLLGKTRMSGQIPLADLYENGATLTLSSDWDVSDLNPFIGMQHALSRGEQVLPNLHEAIAAYTINAAYALETDTKLGSIRIGKLADFTIIDRNLFKIPVAAIGRTKVLYTIVDGEIVYQN